MRGLFGRVVIVTGAMGNLGRAVAQAAYAADAITVLVDHRSDRLDAAFGTGVPDERRLLLPGLDLTQEQAAQAMVRQTLERFGRIDGLVHTVGGFRGGRPVQSEAADTLDHLFDINVRSVERACRAVLPAMVGRRYGRIVTVGAAAGMVAPAGLAAYAASKAAVIRFTEGLAQDLRAHGVTANCVLPSIIDTPENRAAMPGADRRFWVAPQAIAEAILFLLSYYARAVTGASIAVPGTVQGPALSD